MRSLFPFQVFEWLRCKLYTLFLICAPCKNCSFAWRPSHGAFDYLPVWILFDSHGYLSLHLSGKHLFSWFSIPLKTSFWPLPLAISSLSSGFYFSLYLIPPHLMSFGQNHACVRRWYYVDSSNDGLDFIFLVWSYYIVSLIFFGCSLIRQLLPGVGCLAHGNHWGFFQINLRYGMETNMGELCQSAEEPVSPSLTEELLFLHLLQCFSFFLSPESLSCFLLLSSNWTFPPPLLSTHVLRRGMYCI